MLGSIFLLVLLIPILAIFLDSDLGKALAKRLERGQRKGGNEGMHERMVFLEGELDRLARDVERLEEESQFLHKLLDRRPRTGSLPPGDSADT